ncbi:MAG: NAD-dependent epimerase/dehydratase family protein [Phycisphaerae bacterium]|nr:NAD-dependent epimerase/dehydratase family protein [Phycisphaerae bacterium]
MPYELRSQPYRDAFRGRRVLVTGGAGFIGGHLAEALCSLGAEVRVIDDLSSGHRHRVPGQATFFEGSVTDRALVRRAVDGCETVFHEAAMVSVPQSVEQPGRCAEVNILGTECVLEEAVAAKVRRVLFAASAAAYGGEPTLPSREIDPTDCRSPYAASKVAGEVLLAAFARCYPISTVSLRYFNIFGPHQDPKSAYAAAISAFTDILASGRQPTVFGDGQQTRDFTYISNVVHANLLAAASPRTFPGEVLNIGTGVRVSLLETIAGIAKVLGQPNAPAFAAPRAGDVRDSVADIGKARALLAYEPVTAFAEGIEATVRWAAAEASAVR